MMRYLLFILFFSQNILAQDTTHVIQSHLFDFSIDLPTGWYIVEKGRNIKIEGPIPEKMGINYVQDTRSTLDERFNYFLHALRSGPEWKELKTGTQEIHGQAYQWVEYEVFTPGDIVHEILFLTIHKNKLYSITLTSTRERFQAHGAALITLLKSLRMGVGK